MSISDSKKLPIIQIRDTANDLIEGDEMPTPIHVQFRELLLIPRSIFLLGNQEDKIGDFIKKHGNIGN